ncbi:hypothetical protein FGG08_006418 [Glutinoglossum americanum]|uniref:Killer toxin Kp4 domain-containing protein n=1 Tax=Glutinoglossum americanum TaxID=1670608 RepID=A0A9P8L0E8_9PEZI|nr:hypothetical protein FGG08_006418 [Glutinoglossum americanum]
MHFSTGPAALSAVAILVQLASAAPAERLENGLSERALGINCRGSFLCGGKHLDFIVGAINNIDMDKTYKSGDHIACWRHVTPCSLNNINGGECAFLQYTQSELKGSQIKDLIAQLKGHGCGDCGSVPITYPQSNDPSSGILTVNYVSDVGACKSDDGICDASRPQPPPSPPPGPSPQPPPAPNSDKFEWAVIGDSWSSGVAYSYNTQYDNNLDACFRTNEAWGAQMESDTTWTQNPQNFHFVACGGSKMDKLKSSQIGKTGSPQLIVSTIGGNNAFFGTTVDNCVYQGNLGSYGDPYDKDPEGKGECKKSLKKTQDYIDNADSGLGFDLKQTLDDLLASDQAKSHPEFHMYLSSYARFFNSDSDTCNDWSFSPWWRIWKPKLVKELRKEFNDKLDAFHNVYSTVIGSYATPSGMHLGFIPVSDGFDGHRFCEPNHSLKDQWSSDDVWIWNLQYSNPDNGQAEIGEILTDTNGTSYMGQAQGDSESNYQNFTLFSPDAFGPSQPSGSGWSSRPFHPKKVGYTKMKDTIIQRLKGDRVPGVQA